jgi:hypothetical protein
MAKTALGFRVRSGWATAVVLAGPSSAPSVLHVRGVELSDPGFPESRQPFHAVDDSQGDQEPDPNRVQKRTEVVRDAATRSIGQLMAHCRASGWSPRRAGIVAGSLIDPSIIHAPHIRAHAMEGQLFRTTVEDALRALDLRPSVLAEKTVFETASDVIHSGVPILKRTLANLGRGVGGPWRMDEKLAALGAWVAVSQG